MQTIQVQANSIKVTVGEHEQMLTMEEARALLSALLDVVTFEPKSTKHIERFKEVNKAIQAKRHQQSDHNYVYHFRASTPPAPNHHEVSAPNHVPSVTC